MTNVTKSAGSQVGRRSAFLWIDDPRSAASRCLLFSQGIKLQEPSEGIEGFSNKNHRIQDGDDLTADPLSVLS